MNGAHAVLRRDAPAEVKRFHERHGVVFSCSDDGRLAFVYNGPDEVGVVTAIFLGNMKTARLVIAIAALFGVSTRSSNDDRRGSMRTLILVGVIALVALGVGAVALGAPDTTGDVGGSIGSQPTLPSRATATVEVAGPVAVTPWFWQTPGVSPTPMARLPRVLDPVTPMTRLPREVQVTPHITRLPRNEGPPTPTPPTTRIPR